MSDEGKTAFLFPGQGAQYTGMGKDFYEQIEVSRNIYEVAADVCGIDAAELCFTENEQLNITRYTQIAIFTTSLAILKAVERAGIRADVCAGLSLGEYNAVAAAGAMEEKSLFKLVQNRGVYMQEAYPQGGAMAAVLGLDDKKVEEVCEKTEGDVWVANYNCPGQIVITGELEAVKNAGVRLKEQGARRILPLKVSGPFHSPLLKKAAEQLAESLEVMTVKGFAMPYVSNVTADYVTNPGEVKKLLATQVVSPVRWQQSMERLIEDGVTTFVEIGPGKTLNGFMRKINRQARVYNVQKVEDLEQLKEI